MCRCLYLVSCQGSMGGARNPYYISTFLCKTAVSPLITHWRCCSLALNHRYVMTLFIIDWLLAIIPTAHARYGISNHKQIDGLLNRLCTKQQRNQSPPLLLFCEDNPTVIDWFPSQRTGKAENASMPWRHHVGYGESNFAMNSTTFTLWSPWPVFSMWPGHPSHQWSPWTPHRSHKTDPLLPIM